MKAANWILVFGMCLAFWYVIFNIGPKTKPVSTFAVTNIYNGTRDYWVLPREFFATNVNEVVEFLELTNRPGK